MEEGMQEEESEEDDMEEELESEEDSFDPYEGYKDEEEDKLFEGEVRQKSEFLNKSKKDFDDEVDYQVGTNLVERFEKYVGLKSFKTSDWIKKDDIPSEYERIFSYLNYARSQKLAIEESQQHAFLFPGCLVRITIPSLNLSNHQPHTPLIISSLYKYESKITQLHFKIKRYHEYEETIPSK